MFHLVVWCVHDSYRKWRANYIRCKKLSYIKHWLTTWCIRFLIFWLSYSDPNWWTTLQSTLPLRRVPYEKIHNGKEYHHHVQLWFFWKLERTKKIISICGDKHHFYDFIITLIIFNLSNKEVALIQNAFRFLSLQFSIYSERFLVASKSYSQSFPRD